MLAELIKINKIIRNYVAILASVTHKITVIMHIIQIPVGIQQ